MAKRSRTAASELAALYDQPDAELQLPSLKDGRLEGHAYRYLVLLPLISETGEEVFSLARHVPPLTKLLDARFGGSTSTAATPQPPLHGSWLPGEAEQPVSDRNMSITVYSRQVDAADEFFEYLKTVLKGIGRQDEILIERTSVWLPSARRVPRPKQ